MTIPLYSLLILYLIFLAVFVVFALINFYHIVASSSFTFASFVMSFFVTALTVLTLYFTFDLLSNVDWKEPLISFGGEENDEVVNFDNTSPF